MEELNREERAEAVGGPEHNERERTLIGVVGGPPPAAHVDGDERAEAE